MDARTLNDALVKQFPPPRQPGDPLDKESALYLLSAKQRHGVSDTSILATLEGNNLSPDHYATIAFLDAYLTAEIKKAELPPSAASHLGSAIIAVMRIAIADGMTVMTKGHIVPIVENLLALSIGWADTRGKSAELLEQRLENAVLSIQLIAETLVPDPALVRARNTMLELLENDIAGFVSSEQDRIAKLEQRLIDAESGQFTAERSKNLAGQLINKKMRGEVIPGPIVQFLQGAWFDSLQLIAIRLGVNSEEWYTASQLTETLISTVQPNNNLPDKNADGNHECIAEERKQHLYSIIENLPGELKKSLLSLEHDPDAINAELAAIESIHVSVMKGKPVPGCEFAPLGVKESPLDANTRVSQSLLAPVIKLSPGNWFVFSADEGEPKHIKLTLKQDESQQLIFTNRNGANVLQSTYEEFAYLLSSGAARPLPLIGQLLKKIRFMLMAALKMKAEGDEIQEQRSRRQPKEKEQNTIDASRFVLVAVNKNDLAAGAKAEDLIDPAAILSATKANEDTDDVIHYVDKSGTDLGAVNKRQAKRFVSGSGTRMEFRDEMPTSMESFKASILRMRRRPKLITAFADG
jgi:hypothetical protein